MESRTDNTIVIIPSYNEARTIGKIVKDIVNMGLGVLVVDDGSRDHTEREALDNGAMVIRHTENLGKGVSVREGIEYVLDKTNYKWFIMMDGDGQHDPGDIPAFIEATRNGDVDIVIGNRMMQTKTMPSSRYWTNKFTSWVLSRICGQKIPDSQCGYRLIRVDAMKMLELTSDKYDIESEIIVEAAEDSLKIKSVPIRTIYGEEVSGINPIRDTVKFFQLVRKYHKKNELRTAAKKDG
ncbi:MAG: glycosyltransferase family 2 protein [Candidatus Omnitrophota bacterium]